MPAVQFSNCENLRSSFERKHKLTGKARALIYALYLAFGFFFWIRTGHHHHHQVPDLEQTLATMPLQTSLSSDNFKKFKPLLCPPAAELQRLSRNVILCLPLSRLPSTFPVKDKNSKSLRETTVVPSQENHDKTKHRT